jgi:hypothetical protein
MAKAGPIVGGILALVGGSLTLIAAIQIMPWTAIDPQFMVTFLVTLIMAILGLVGGILMLVGKKVGGILALIGGAVLIAGFWITIGYYGMIDIPLATHWSTLTGPGFYLDPIMAIAGGIVGLVSISSD